MNPVRSSIQTIKPMNISIKLHLSILLAEATCSQGMNPVRGKSSQVSLISSVNINLDHITSNYLLLTKATCL